MECNRHCEIPLPSLRPSPSTSCSCTHIWPTDLDRYLLLSSSYRLPHGCVVPWAKKIGISMIHNPPIPPLPHTSPPALNIPLLCWISLVKLCKHRKGARLCTHRTLYNSLIGASCHYLYQLLVKCCHALSHKDKNCTKLSTFTHSSSLFSSFGL